MTRRTFACAAVLAVAAVAAPAQPVEETVTVRCGEPGETIAAALETAADRLVVLVAGTCAENVVIRRSDVTLAGASGDASTDRIVGVEPGLATRAVVEVSDAARVRIEDLAIGGGMGPGLGAWRAEGLEVQGCRLEGNRDSGGHFSLDSDVAVADTLFAGNVGFGARVQRGARLTCSGCVFEDNGDFALSVGEAAKASVSSWAGRGVPVQSRLAGRLGLACNDASTLLWDYGFVDTGYGASSLALVAAGGCQARLFKAAMSGGITLRDKALVELENVRIEPSPLRGHHLYGDAALRLDATVVIGDLWVHEFSKVMARGGTSITGSLGCDSGGDAFRDPRVHLSGTVGGCPSWIP
ncbi:MAG: right-handed parallel beta-helix repeat-containing protein [Acidobacteriota bacterium]